MIDEDLLRRGLDLTLAQTQFEGLGQLQRGKVRDSYRWPDGRRAIVVSDRVSVYDRVIGTVPFKGQILNGISNYWFEATADVCENHLLEAIDPAVSVVLECEAFPVEVVVRGFLTGSSATSLWTLYAAGERMPYGHALPEGLREHEPLAAPLITPTTKGAVGEHDLPLSLAEVRQRGLLAADEMEAVTSSALALFARGQMLAAERGLLLVDTKYEFGRTPDGRVIVIDEIHTPDSSRYWLAESYEDALSRGEAPLSIDKDFLRHHMRARGFCGEGEPPPLSDDTRLEATQRYLALYKQLTGCELLIDASPPEERIERSLRRAF
ncbi:MAG: phosphoribosylaminoimidazolesuccinocarboxamide synthase [Deltaproteobacteria bacterium]|nr:phosphoribosylaminoimidazolesuccinocarboxamide synthase [Deltaproteobacteria bacterium]